MRERVTLIVESVGVLAVVTGVALWSIPAAFITFGVAAIVFGETR
jgi:hypothetical protein